MKGVREREVPGAGQTLRAHGVHPVLARAYAARGVASPREINYLLGRLADAPTLGGLAHAGQIVGECVVRGDLIAVAGDWDADGATSTAILVEALTAFGAPAPLALIPSRFTQGYGLSPALVDAARAGGARLIITVDNGTTAFEAIEHAWDAGIPVVVTDHHLVSVGADGKARLPRAHALVNPSLPGDPFPWKNTCGAGVALYLASAVRAFLHERGHAGGQVSLGGLLDLVAIGTVADVVSLDFNNRILVAQGLERMRASPRPGIEALFVAAHRDVRSATAEDLAFLIGPRINAAGRLATMDLGVKLLLERDPARAAEMAQTLDGLNRERREIESAAVEDALARLPEHIESYASGRALAVFGEDWHEGVVGLVASRLKERFHRPVVALCRAQDGKIKGSGRSIPGVHLRDVLARVNDRHPGMLLSFGGHAMAAGLMVAPDRVEDFRDAFHVIAGLMVPEEALHPVVLSDGNLGNEDLSLATARTIAEGGPWGNGFPEPLFHGTFTVRGHRILKDAHRALTLERDGETFRGIQFRNTDTPGGEITIAYRLRADSWNEEERLQLIVEEEVDPCTPDLAPR